MTGGLYIHIPFCKKACHYCDFHFSTSLKLQDHFLEALHKELHLRKDEIWGLKVETIYFGGGTPSILDTEALKSILETITEQYEILPGAEITLEANPDDLSLQKLKALKTTEINRFSIGVQSFFEEDLRYMNRAHRATDAEYAIKAAQDTGFENLTIDLIYGTPTMPDENWQYNLEKALELSIPHISSYALTVEENTPLFHLIKKQTFKNPEEEQSAHQFTMLVEILESQGFEQYEISNFARPGARSRHNASYWQGKPYLGFGPSAHSFDGEKTRRWNISHNPGYIKGVLEGISYGEQEILTEHDRFNERIMTRLRLKEGLDLQQLALEFGSEASIQTEEIIKTFNKEYWRMEGHFLQLTTPGKLLADKLAAALFRVE